MIYLFITFLSLSCKLTVVIQTVRIYRKHLLKYFDKMPWNQNSRRSSCQIKISFEEVYALIWRPIKLSAQLYNRIFNYPNIWSCLDLKFLGLTLEFTSFLNWDTTRDESPKLIQRQTNTSEKAINSEVFLNWNFHFLLFWLTKKGDTRICFG